MCKRNPSTWSGAEKEAVCNELKRINDHVTRNAEARVEGGRGESDQLSNSEYYFELIDAVAAIPDTMAIRPLAGALGTGSMVRRGLLSHGGSAVEGVIAEAASRRNQPDLTASGLTTLREILSTKGLVLSEAARRATIAFAAEHLAHSSHGSVLMEAVALAVATGDPGLREDVTKLSQSRDEIARRGIRDERWVKLVQERAAAALESRRK
jgi:hypothetical protein